MLRQFSLVNKTPKRMDLFGMAALAFSTCFCLWGCGSMNAEKKIASAPVPATAEPVLVVPVKKENLNIVNELPGELLAFRDVAIHAKVEGYISWIGVDRGSSVKVGQEMIKISCPELDEKLREAEAKLAIAESTWRESQSRYQAELEHQSEAKAQYEADELTASRLFETNKTPGAVAQNDVDQAQKKAEADKSRIQAVAANVKAMDSLVLSQKNNIQASRNLLQSIRSMQSYLTIRAPFDGTITERNVHEGSIVAVESSKTAEPLVRIQQRNRLRLVVAVPEADVSGITKGRELTFSVPAFPGRKFKGAIARPGYALDHSTRTMPVELEVDNLKGELEPGMYTKVDWKQSRSKESLFVPVSSVGTDLKGSYVIRVRNNATKRIVVNTGFPMGNLIEIDGTVAAGDTVMLRADDRADSELKEGVRLANTPEIIAANKRSAVAGE
jgi:multidrug efflux pump subunit AcrA (membrane-fusion protein)